MAYTPPRHLGGKPGDPAVPGQWIVARTSTIDPYPCTCRYTPCRYERCPDRERSDPQNLPDECCGGLAARQHRERTGQTTPATPRQAAATGWAQPSRKPAPAARREQSPRPLAEDDLWAMPLQDAPPAWDAIDEASPSHGSLTAAPQGGSVPPGPAHQGGDQPEPSRRSGRARQCDCRTPWDGDPPVLLVADAAKTGSRVSWRHPLSRTPGVDLRAEAERALTENGYALKRDWKDGRHGLLPGGPRKTRSGWVAPIREEVGGGVAVIDVPPEGNGVHCPDCHRNFANASAAQIHRTSWLGQCKDPATIRVIQSTEVEPGGLRSGVAIASQLVAVVYAGPMLVRGKDGVWSIDPACPWSRVKKRAPGADDGWGPPR